MVTFAVFKSCPSDLNTTLVSAVCNQATLITSFFVETSFGIDSCFRMYLGAAYNLT